MSVKGPFILRCGPRIEGEEAGASGEGAAWLDIIDAEGHIIVSITGQLVDGSGRRDKYPDGVIRSRAQRKAEAEFVLAAMNEAWWAGKV